MGTSIVSLLVLAALSSGEPVNVPHVSYQKGLFCDTADLVASVVEIADKGGDPYKAVSDLNRTLDRRACLYTTKVDVLAQVVKFERKVAAQNATYGIYQVYVSAFGHHATEIGDLTWKFSQPVVMYTLREAPADSVEQETTKPNA
jgi:hypothetical protein